MALSPFGSRSPSMTVHSPNTAIKLRATAAQNSASGTVASVKAVQNEDRELTEQLNIDVRERYVKGMYSSHVLQDLQC
jgi:cyclin-dependent kinase 7